jgi:hypothetical protein
MSIGVNGVKLKNGCLLIRARSSFKTSSALEAHYSSDSYEANPNFFKINAKQLPRIINQTKDFAERGGDFAKIWANPKVTDQPLQSNHSKQQALLLLLPTPPPPSYTFLHHHHLPPPKKTFLSRVKPLCALWFKPSAAPP